MQIAAIITGLFIVMASVAALAIALFMSDD